MVLYSKSLSGTFLFNPVDLLGPAPLTKKVEGISRQASFRISNANGKKMAKPERATTELPPFSFVNCKLLPVSSFIHCFSIFRFRHSYRTTQHEGISFRCAHAVGNGAVEQEDEDFGRGVTSDGVGEFLKYVGMTNGTRRRRNDPSEHSFW